MAAGSVPAPGDIAEEDREIYHNLARLQKIHQQVFELRTLLPDKLILPSQTALGARGKTAPQRVASDLKAAAVTGSKSIKSFQAEYESDEMKALWQNTVSVQLAQGDDVWTHDYGNLASKPGSAPGRIDAVIATPKQSGTDSAGMDDEAILESFSSLHPDVKTARVKEGHVLPLQVDTDSISFLVDRQASAEGATLHVTLLNDQSATPEAKEVLARILDEGKSQRLGRVLSLLASYKGFKSQPCSKCGRVFDSNLELAIYRKLKQAGSGDALPAWISLHQSCTS
ncbi:hypothetical protein DV738_g4558, partial [Chaetothyriales sp. CBS 135597]